MRMRCGPFLPGMRAPSRRPSGPGPRACAPGCGASQRKRPGKMLRRKGAKLRPLLSGPAMRADSLWALTAGFRGPFGLAAWALLLASGALLLVPLLGTFAIDVALAGNLTPGTPVLRALAEGFAEHALLAYLLLSAGGIVLVT